MSTGMNKMLQILEYVLLGVSALLGVIFLSGYISEDIIIYWCYFLLAVAALAAIGFSIANMFTNPKKAKSSLVGLVALIVVFGIAYVLGGDEVLPAYKGVISNPEASKRVSMGLISFYILGAGAVVTVIYVEISKAFK